MTNSSLKYLSASIGLILCIWTVQSRPTKLAYGTTWGIYYTDPYYYYIAEELNGDQLGLDYACWASVQSACTIWSMRPPDVLGRIPRVDCVVISNLAQFEDLNPAF